MTRRIKLSNNKKRKLAQLITVAGQAIQQGHTPQCSSACDEIESIYPHHPDALHLRGLLAMQQGNIEQAFEQLQQAIDRAPSRADFLASLGNLQIQTGDTDAAIANYKQALNLDSNNIATHLGLAGALMAQDKHHEALELLERIKKRKPGDASIRMGLFHACHALKRYDAGRSHLQAIIARDAGYSEAHYGLAILSLEQGDMEAARRHIQHTLEINPYHCDAWLVRVDLQHYKASDNDIEIMQQISQQCPEGSDAAMKMAFALAKAEDDLGHYDEAFSLLQKANAIRHQQNNFDTTAAIAGLDQIIQTCSSEIMNKYVETETLQHKPLLFIVGMPRSGTTLVEQILAAHPEVTALGENGFLQAAIHNVVGPSLSPAELNSLPNEQCAAIGASYVKRIEQEYGSDSFYCDKTLSHINLIGLIHRALPQARFIHLQRHPLDTCLSIYKNNLQGIDYAYGFNLSELASYYAAYQRLMSHWNNVLPGGALYHMNYEQLVEHQESQTRTLLQACKLTWNESCMHFQQARHAVQTASAIQVRKPLSSRSIGLWHHYEQALRPLQGLVAKIN